jgi:hypothetical protein
MGFFSENKKILSAKILWGKISWPERFKKKELIILPCKETFLWKKIILVEWEKACTLPKISPKIWILCKFIFFILNRCSIYTSFGVFTFLWNHRKLYVNTFSHKSLTCQMKNWKWKFQNLLDLASRNINTLFVDVDYQLTRRLWMIQSLSCVLMGLLLWTR